MANTTLWRLLAIGSSAFLMLGPLAVGCAQTPNAPAASPIADRIPPHDTLTVASAAVGEPRLINIYTPPSYRTSGSARFPTLYMPDGGLDEDFPHVVNTVDSLIA